MKMKLNKYFNCKINNKENTYLSLNIKYKNQNKIIKSIIFILKKKIIFYYCFNYNNYFILYI